jgi:predicted RNA-binding Zn-ribbon protein involved in translation (DUF1610 family)
MGMKCDVVCPACGYRAHVSGGPDGGFVGMTQTISCNDCRELCDVSVGTVSKYERKVTSKKKPRCPVSAKHVWQEWTHPGPCPKCGTTMNHDPNGNVTMWD